MCKIMEELVNDRLKEINIEMAKKMLAEGISFEVVVKCSGLTLEEVKELMVQSV